MIIQRSNTSSKGTQYSIISIALFGFLSQSEARKKQKSANRKHQSPVRLELNRPKSRHASLRCITDDDTSFIVRTTVQVGWK